MREHRSVHAASLSERVLQGIGLAALLTLMRLIAGIGSSEGIDTAGLVLLFGAGMLSGRLIRPKRDAVVVGAIVGLLSGIAVSLSVLAYQRGPVAIVAAVIGLAPGPTVLFAWWLMNEKINRVQLAGFALGAAAVALFAVV